MSRYGQERIRGSLWTKGPFGVIVGAAIIIFLIVRVPVARWFIGIAVLIGLVLVPGIRWYHEKFPVKDPDEDKIKLHLND